jgi:hypothetical protein
VPGPGWTLWRWKSPPLPASESWPGNCWPVVFFTITTFTSHMCSGLEGSKEGERRQGNVELWYQINGLERWFQWMRIVLLNMFALDSTANLVGKCYSRYFSHRNWLCLPANMLRYAILPKWRNRELGRYLGCVAKTVLTCSPWTDKRKPVFFRSLPSSGSVSLIREIGVLLAVTAHQVTCRLLFIDASKILRDAPAEFGSVPLSSRWYHPP